MYRYCKYGRNKPDCQVCVNNAMLLFDKHKTLV